MKRLSIPLLLIFSFLFLTGFQAEPPPQADWQTVFSYLIAGVIAVAGAPVIQLVKNLLTKIFKKPIEDHWAVLVTGIVSGLLAVAQMWLAQQLSAADFTAAGFPLAFWRILAVASVYYGLMKGSQSVLGRGFLLKSA